MVGGNCCGDVLAGIGDEFGGICGGNVLQNDFQRRKGGDNTFEVALNKFRFAVEDVDIGISDFAMDQQWHTLLRHFIQHRPQAIDVGDASVGIGCGPRGI